VLKGVSVENVVVKYEDNKQLIQKPIPTGPTKQCGVIDIRVTEYNVVLNTMVL